MKTNNLINPFILCGTKEEVEAFLSHFRSKLLIHELFFTPRDKQKLGLEGLDIMPYERDEYIKNLSAENYVSGPNQDTNDLSRPPYFTFGIVLKGMEVYIKINIGKENKPPVCFSFHAAEFPLKYPYKYKPK